MAVHANCFINLTPLSVWYYMVIFIELFTSRCSPQCQLLRSCQMASNLLTADEYNSAAWRLRGTTTASWLQHPKELSTTDEILFVHTFSTKQTKDLNQPFNLQWVICQWARLKLQHTTPKIPTPEPIAVSVGMMSNFLACGGHAFNDTKLFSSRNGFK